MQKGKSLLRKALLEMNKEKPDLRKAFDLLEKSAEQNNFEALYALGSWYLNGRFVKKNVSLAVEYFLRAIDGNNCSAYYDLAVCYEKGIGVKKNLKKAFDFYLNAALSGDIQSLYEVGRCYYHGIGVAKNMHISNIWLEQAEINGITK